MGAILLGLDDLEEKLKSLGLSVQGKLLKEAGKVAAEPIRAEASALAPRRSGTLSGGIRIRALAESTPSEAAVRVEPGKKAFYGYFQEFGTGRMFNVSGARAWGHPGKSGTSGKGHSRSNRPQPFLVPAYEHNKDAALAAYAAAFRAAVESYVKK